MTDTPRLWDRRADETPKSFTRPSSPTSPSARADPSVKAARQRGVRGGAGLVFCGDLCG